MTVDNNRILKFYGVHSAAVLSFTFHEKSSSVVLIVLIIQNKDNIPHLGVIYLALISVTFAIVSNTGFFFLSF